jgi:hypothetical protein
VFRVIFAALGAVLVLFHVGVLAGQAWDGELADPGVLFRWLLAGGLAWALSFLRRTGVPIFLSQKAVALWLLAAVLHGPAMADRMTVDTPYLPETGTLVIEVVTASAALGLGVVLLGWLFGRSPALNRICSDAARAHALTRSPTFAFVVVFAPRPPPSRCV